MAIFLLSMFHCPDEVWEEEVHDDIMHFRIPKAGGETGGTC